MSLQDRINSRMDKEAFKNFIPSNAEEQDIIKQLKELRKSKGFTRTQLFIWSSIL